MKTITVSVTKIPPKGLFLVRWAVKLVGATIVVCQPKRRKAVTTDTYYDDGKTPPTFTAANIPKSIGHK